MKNILIADDHSIVRLGATLVINNLFKGCNIQQAEKYQDILKFLELTSFDLLLLDINMPGGNNIQMIKDLKSIQENLKILVFSSYDEHLYALRYIEAGAAGYLNKTTGMDELAYAISCIEKKGKYMSEAIKDQYISKIVTSKSKVTSTNPLLKLSNREMDVAKHLIQGLGILEVSNLLKVSTSTISTYKGRIFDKLNINSLPELIELYNIHATG